MRDNEFIVKRLFKILCNYKPQPIALYDYLHNVMTGKFYPDRTLLYEKDNTVVDALFVSDGYVACYGYDDHGERQVVSLYGKDTIIAGKSFTSQLPSTFDWIALPGAYLMKIGHDNMKEVYATFPDAEELARLIMADIAEKELERIRLLKRDAKTVVLDFYNSHEAFKEVGKVMVDADIASYLLMSERTLRAARAELIKAGSL